MGFIDKVVCFGLTLIVGTSVLNKTLDIIHPNRPKGFFQRMIFDFKMSFKNIGELPR